MCEVYKPIEGYEDLYEVSDEGNVRNKTTGKLLKQHKVSEYLLVNLYSNGIRKNYLVHRLVAETFIPNPDNKPEVDHVDENKLNNSVDNLRWVNHQENIDHSLSKPVAQFSLDGRLLNTYKSIRKAERETGINKTNICYCCLGKGYQQVVLSGSMFKRGKEVINPSHFFYSSKISKCLNFFPEAGVAVIVAVDPKGKSPPPSTVP